MTVRICDLMNSTDVFEKLAGIALIGKIIIYIIYIFLFINK
jgi:hypothetical protein